MPTTLGPPFRRFVSTGSLTGNITAVNLELAQLDKDTWYEFVFTVDAYVQSNKVTGVTATSASTFVPANVPVLHYVGVASSGTDHPGSWVSFVRVGAVDGVYHCHKLWPVQ